MGKIISVSNQKGGVGKTTTVVNLCACLAMKGKKILLIDIDAQGNSTSGYGFDVKSINKSVYDVLINETPLSEVLLKTSIDNLYLCPANSNVAGAEIELVSVLGREYRLKFKLDKEKDEFDFIFIDCPPSLSLLTINSLTCADSVLIPVQCEYYALEGLGKLIETVSLLKKGLNINLEIEGILLTMFDSRTSLSVQVVEEVKKHFGNKVFKTIIPRNVRLSEAPSYGVPIVIYDNKSKGAECYLDLAEEMLEEYSLKEKKKKKENK